VTKLISDHKSAKSQRAFAELMKQKKIDIAAIQKAYDG
jgi:predicted 3-demethylubiquinone-9 3-methyltransferase (glyoxalase superfamily)